MATAPFPITGGMMEHKKAAGSKPPMVDAQELAVKALDHQRAEKKAGRSVSITDAVNHVTHK